MVRILLSGLLLLSLLAGCGSASPSPAVNDTPATGEQVAGTMAITVYRSPT